MIQRTVRFYEVLNADGKQFPGLVWDDFLTAVRRLPETDAYVTWVPPANPPKGFDLYPADCCEDEPQRLLQCAGAEPGKPKAAENLRYGNTHKRGELLGSHFTYHPQGSRESNYRLLQCRSPPRQ